MAGDGENGADRCGKAPLTQDPPAATLPVDTSVTVRTVKCAYLHGRHLTGCRNPAEPGSRFCAEHGGGS